MTEKRVDRLQELDEVMAELQALRDGPPVKSMVVVQSADSPRVAAPALASGTPKHDLRLIVSICALAVLGLGLWFARGNSRNPIDPATAAVIADQPRLAKLKLAVTQATNGDAELALHDVETLTNADCSNVELLTAATAFAAGAMRPNTDRVLAEHRAARAVLFLQRAATQGFADAEALRADPSLASLQNRRDFQMLILQLRRR